MRFTSVFCSILLLMLALAPGVPLAGDQDGPLDLGIFPRRPAADTQRMFRPLADYLSERLGTPVTLDAPADYRAFWGAIRQGRYDLVHYNQYQYIRGKKEFGHEIVAKNEEFGRSQLHATIYVRKDSKHRTLADLRGRKVLFGGDETAIIGYILPTEMLRQAGLRSGDYIEQFAQNPVKAIIALHYMQGDAAAAGDFVTSLPLVRQTIGDDKVRVLAQSIGLPHLPWAVGARVTPERRVRIRDALVSLNDSARGREILEGLQLTGLRAARDSDYDVVRDLIDSVLGESY